MVDKKKYCICGHPKERHNIDNFGRYLCDHTKDFPDGTYIFDCDCMQYKEKKEVIKMTTTKEWIKKKDDKLGNVLQRKIETGGIVTIPLPKIFRATAKKRYGTTLQLFRKRKKYHSFELNFLDDKIVAEALEGRKLKITIEIDE